MHWLAEIWKWLDAQLVNWFVVLWWFTAFVFLVSAGARWWAWRRFGDAPQSGSDARQSTWGGVLLLAVSASWWGDWKRLAAPLATRGGEGRFVLAVLAAHVLPIYALLIIYALGKEYLLVYLGSAAIFIPLVVLGARVLLSFPEADGRAPGVSVPERSRTPPWRAPIHELAGVAPRFGYGLLLAALLAAIAIHPDWTFPVEITGSGLVSQFLNALFGAVVAIGAWTPPVGAFLFAVPVWRGGFALAGLYAFLFAVPAAPQAVMTYAEWVGRREAAKLAVLVLGGAVAAGLIAAVVVSVAGLPLPYVYSPAQLL